MREGASNRQDRTAHTGSHTFLTTQLSRHERHEERPPFIADLPKKVQELQILGACSIRGGHSIRLPGLPNGSLFSSSICRSSF